MGFVQNKQIRKSLWAQGNCEEHFSFFFLNKMKIIFSFSPTRYSPTVATVAVAVDKMDFPQLPQYPQPP